MDPSVLELGHASEILTIHDLMATGALYTPPPELVASVAGFQAAPAAAAAAAAGGASGGGQSAAVESPQKAPVQASARRGRAARRDPGEPKQNKTPFNFFSIAARAKAKAEHPDADQKVFFLPRMRLCACGSCTIGLGSVSHTEFICMMLCGDDRALHACAMVVHIPGSS
jgi:hypothetical protein